MSLMNQVITNTTPGPPKIILYAMPGVGKTTFAAQANALLVDVENGAANVPNLTRTPYIENWPTVKAWLQEVAASNSKPETLAIDTLDWLVHRIAEHVVHDLDPKSPGITNTVAGSHGGYFKAREIIINIVFRELLPLLNTINNAGVPIIMLAHATNLTTTTPEGMEVKMAAPDIDKFILPTFTEWADAVLYGHRSVDDSRVMTCRGTNIITAKNRYGLPDQIEMDWKVLKKAVFAQSANRPAA